MSEHNNVVPFQTKAPVPLESFVNDLLLSTCIVDQSQKPYVFDVTEQAFAAYEAGDNNQNLANIVNAVTEARAQGFQPCVIQSGLPLVPALEGFDQVVMRAHVLTTRLGMVMDHPDYEREVLGAMIDLNQFIGAKNNPAMQSLVPNVPPETTLAQMVFRTIMRLCLANAKAGTPTGRALGEYVAGLVLEGRAQEEAEAAQAAQAAVAGQEMVSLGKINAVELMAPQGEAAPAGNDAAGGEAV